MCSSYSALDCILSHWTHFTVHRFIFVFVFFVYCFTLHSCCSIVSAVGWTWCDWSLILRTLSSFSALTLLVGSLSRKAVPDMTYNVFGGTLNLNQSTVHLSALGLLVGPSWKFYHRYICWQRRTDKCLKSSASVSGPRHFKEHFNIAR